MTYQIVSRSGAPVMNCATLEQAKEKATHLSKRFGPLTVLRIETVWTTQMLDEAIAEEEQA